MTETADALRRSAPKRSRATAAGLLRAVTRESVDAIERALPPFPEEKIMSCFEQTGVPCHEEVSREFSKFFAVLAEACGGRLEGKRVVDVGAGLGVFVAQAKSLGMVPLGTDIFIEYEGNCHQGALCVWDAYGHPREEGRRAFIEHDILAGPVPGGPFDFVTTFGMLEHIFDPEERRLAIRNMIASLAPGGTLLLSCGPNAFFPVDFFHYGPKFVFYHWFPEGGRKVYLRLFGRFTAPGQSMDPRFLDGMRVEEIRRAILDASPGAAIAQLFPLWVRLGRSRWLRMPGFSGLARAAAALLAALKAEPVVILVATIAEASGE